MALFTDDFTGTDNDLVSARTGWTTDGSGATNVALLNGAGATKTTTVVSDAKAVVHDEGDVDHYAEVVVGANVSGNSSGPLFVGVRMTPSNRAIGYFLTYDGTLRIRKLNPSAVPLTPDWTGTISAGDTVRLEAENNVGDTEVTLRAYVNGTLRITATDTSHLTTTYTGFRYSSNATKAEIVRNWESDVLAAGDTTAPTLTSVSGTDTGSTSATVSVSSTEAGPGWAVLTPTSTQPSQAQVEAGQDHTGSTTGVFLDTATLAIGANPGAFVLTGLTPGATYWPHVVAKDTATPTANVSAVESGPSFTMPAPDVTAPAWPPGTTLDIVSKTDTTVTLEASADATDAVGVDGYAWSSDGGATYPFTSLTKTFTFTALTELTSYAFRCVPYDAAPNTGTHITVTTSTYRAGDTGQNIRDNTGPVGGNPAGFLYNKVTLPADADLWFSYVITTPPATGSFTTLEPNGNFVFVGPNPETMFVQLEVDGANFGAPFEVTLYDATSQLATPSNAVSTGTATRSSATQTFEATAVSATSIGTATRSAATPPTSVPVQPVNAVSTGRAGRSFVRSLSRARAASWTRYPAGTAQSTYPLR